MELPPRSTFDQIEIDLRPDIDAGRVSRCQPPGCSNQQEAAAATDIKNLFVAAPGVEREHTVAMAKLA